MLLIRVEAPLFSEKNFPLAYSSEFRGTSMLFPFQQTRPHHPGRSPNRTDFSGSILSRKNKGCVARRINSAPSPLCCADVGSVVQPAPVVQSHTHGENPYAKLGKGRRDSGGENGFAMGYQSPFAFCKRIWSRRIVSRPVALGGAGLAGWGGFFVGGGGKRVRGGGWN